MAPAALTSALSSMELMLDALMQRGIGKPEEPTKPKEEEEPPALPTRPTGRGRRLPATQRPGGTAAAPWNLPSMEKQPTTQEEDKEFLANLELEKKAAMAAEEEVKQEEEETRQKEDIITTLQRKVEHYESRLSECEVRMKSVEAELQRQITSLLMAQTAGCRKDGSTKHSQESSSRGGLPLSQPSSVRHQQHGSDHAVVVAVVAVAAAADERTLEEEEPVNQMAREFHPEPEREQASEHNARAVEEPVNQMAREIQPEPVNQMAREFQPEPVNQMAREFQPEPVNQMAREIQPEPERELVCDHNACAVAVVSGPPPPPPPPSSAKSVEELKMLKKQFASWKREYEAQLKKTKGELKKLVHAEKKSGGGSSGGDGHAHRRCGWWRIKAPKCRAPKCCSFKLPSAKSCCCCCFCR